MTAKQSASVASVVAPLGNSRAVAPRPAPRAPPTPAPAVQPTVFVIVMENHAYRELVDSPRAPYLNELIAAHGLATHYTDDGHHPS